MIDLKSGHPWSDDSQVIHYARHPYQHTLANSYTNVSTAYIAPSHHSFVSEFTFKYWSQAVLLFLSSLN